MHEMITWLLNNSVSLKKKLKNKKHSECANLYHA